MDMLELNKNPAIDEYPEPAVQTIQPYGVLIAIDQTNLSIIHVSKNSQKYLGLKPKELVGSPLKNLLDLSQISELIDNLDASAKKIHPQVLKIKARPKQLFNGFLHATPEAIILELEPQQRSCEFLAIDALIHQAIDRMEQTETLEDLLSVTVNEVQQLIGYDRVMIYKFDHQGDGAVIAEAVKENVSSYLGLHFPAHDIPAQAREHFALSKVRSIPHVQANPVHLYPKPHSETSGSLNLDLATLKSPTQCHMQYLRNMGVAASLVTPLLQSKHPWGIIACHNMTPKAIPYETRAACKLLSQMAGARLTNRFTEQYVGEQNKLDLLRAELVSDLSHSDNFLKFLSTPTDRLFEVVNAQGAAVILGETTEVMGETPSLEEIQALLPWLKSHIKNNLFQTNSLPSIYPAAEGFKAIGSGLLCLQISEAHHYYILWFRKEVTQTVNWGGDPHEGIAVDSDGNLQLTPRASFELWQESVQASALPWKDFEINGAIELRNTIVGLVLKRADELATLNLELTHSNRELNSFSHAAAHDLKEPLRGIYNFSTILLEDYSEVLDEDGLEYLNDIQTFTQRMELLITSLLRVSHVRQTELVFTKVYLGKIVAQSVQICRASRPESPFELKIPQDFPEVQGDPVLLNEVFQNLISNALKYNEREKKWVEVGYYSDPDRNDQTIFYVRDNGIGIRPEHHEKIFKLFKRLHAQDKYDGGAGAGLALVQNIIERHGGSIWVESEPGEGSKFCFTLQIDSDNSAEK